MARRTTTRDRLVATAGELFWRQGYAGTGVSEIIRDADATSGSFYHFFSTKDDLLLAVLDAVAERLDRDLLVPIERLSEGAAGRVVNLASAYRERVTGDDSGWGLPIGALAGELGAGHEPARRRVDEIYRAYVTRVGDWFGADGRSTAELVVAVLEGGALMASAGGDGAVLDHCGRRLAAALGERGDLEPPERVAVQAAVPRAPGSADWKAW